MTATFWRIATSALLTLTWSLPAFATSNHARDRIAVERLAVGLDASARQVDHRVRTIPRYRGSHNWETLRAATAIGELNEATRHFRQLVARNRVSLSHLVEDFDRVTDAYLTAVYHAERAQLPRSVEQDLQVVEHWLFKIEDRYMPATRHAKHWKNGRLDRYDRRDGIGYADEFAKGRFKGNISNISNISNIGKPKGAIQDDGIHGKQRYDSKTDLVKYDDPRTEYEKHEYDGKGQVAGRNTSARYADTRSFFGALFGIQRYDH